MLRFWMVWWAFDDHLATAVNSPGLGDLPIWVPLLIGLAMTAVVAVDKKTTLD